ncbi:MAG: polysaccharide biosynthesis/export family protein [Fluviibacter sp.]
MMRQLVRLSTGLLLTSALLLCGCTLIPGTYEFSQTYVPMGSMPSTKTLAITPAVIDELDAQDKERKAQLNKQALLIEKRLANTTPCKTGNAADAYNSKNNRTSPNTRGGQSSPCDPRENTPDSYVYRLGVGDKLMINVWGNPDLNLVGSATATNMTTPSASGAQRFVGANGKLYYPFVGEIQAEGLTISQFRSALIRSLSAYIKDPQIDVGVVSFQSQKVYLTGDVGKQGVYPITDIPLRVTDLIGQAGLSPTADLYNVILTRDGKNTSLDLYDLYYEGRSGENVLLKNGDRITVPDDKSRKVFVMGEVLGSKSYVMRRGKMSLTEVLMDAGGINQSTSAPGRIYVLRADQDGNPIIYQLHAGQPDGFVLGERFAMKPRDFVFVNPTDLAMIGRVIGQLFPFMSAGSAAVGLGVGQ